MPRALPTTESRASRRPTVRARPIVKSRLGPGTWMKRALATTKASHWLVVGTDSLSGLGAFPAHLFPMGGSHAHRAASDVEVARGPRLVLLGALALAGLATIVGLVALWPDGAEVDEVTSEVSFAAPGVTFADA